MTHSSRHTRLVLRAVVCCVAVATCVIASRPCPATTRQVPTTLYPTIQSGINSSANGDVVIVADGTYSGVGNVNLTFSGREITVRSQNGPDACIIDCKNLNRGVRFTQGEEPDAILDGFTIMRGSSTANGGAIYCLNSSPTIRNCKITGSKSLIEGGGIALVGSDATIENCTITGNRSPVASGGGLCFLANSGAAVVNCTITGNRSGLAGGAVYTFDSDPIFINCILYDNGPDEMSVDGVAAPELNYCDIEGGWSGTGTGNIDADPLFIDPGAWAGNPLTFGTWTDGNYLTLATSPCIDAGFGDSGATVPTTDIRGLARVDYPFVANTGVGTPAYVDIGAYERQPAAPVPEDSYADILWRETTTGEVGVWLMNGITQEQAAVVATVDPTTTDWEIMGTGDFDGDGKHDVLWRETTTGDVAVWLMNGVAWKRTAVIATVDPTTTDWEIVGTGDFNGDGKHDILWYETTTGDVGIWLMNGTVYSRAGIVATVAPATAWTIKGTGDFNGDGKGDIMWRNATSGEVAVWLMNGLSFANTGIVATVAPATMWEIEGTGDFDGDGKSDVLWRKTSTTGEVAVWIMNGFTITRTGIVATVDPTTTDWDIKGTGDFDGDGKDDILWRETTTGDIGMWLMNGVASKQMAVIATITTTWLIKGVGDFNGPE